MTPTTLAETILRDVPRHSGCEVIRPVTVMHEHEVLAALTAAMDPAIAERAGEVVPKLRAMPTYSGDPKTPHWAPDVAADLITALLAQNAALRVERDVATDRLSRAYTERTSAAVAMARFALMCGYPAGIGKDSNEDWDDEWRVVLYVETPAGQVSWHIAPCDQHFLAGLPQYSGAWDGTFRSRDGIYCAWDHTAVAQNAALRAERDTCPIGMSDEDRDLGLCSAATCRVCLGRHMVAWRARAEAAEAQNAALRAEVEKEAKAHEKEIYVWSENYAGLERKLAAAEAQIAALTARVEGLTGALREITERPSKMKWGEEYEVRSAMSDMEELALAALTTEADNG